MTSITCPRCRRTSHHPVDVQQGYCAGCGDWTSAPASAFGLPIVIEQATGIELQTAELGICPHCHVVSLELKHVGAGFNWRQCGRCRRVYVTQPAQRDLVL